MIACVRCLFLSIIVALYSLPVQAAIDSYRFLHVTIETPWFIFLFLLIGVLSPFVLMAVLMWRTAIQKNNREIDDSDHPASPD